MQDNSQGQLPPVYSFHICYPSGKKNEAGVELSTGVTLAAHSALEALAIFTQAHPEVEPIYLINLDAPIHRTGARN